MDPVERAAELARRVIAPHPDLHLAEGIPPGIWSALGEAGLLGLLLPVEFGGQGAGRRVLMEVCAALARHGRSLGVASSCLSHNTLSSFLIDRLGTPGQRAALLPALAAGRMRLAVAISELGAGAHPKHLRTAARREGDGWVIDGEKAYVTNGPDADLYVVLAVTAVDAGRKRYTALLVPRGTPGLELTPAAYVDFLRPCGHAGLRLDGCRVPADAVLGPEGDGYAALALPLRSVEDVNGLGPRIGGMRAQLEWFAERGLPDDPELLAGLGALLAAVEGIEAVTAALLAAAEAGDARRAETLLLTAKHWARQFQADFAVLLARRGEPSDPGLERFTRDLTKSLDVARAVQLTRLRRLAETIR